MHVNMMIRPTVKIINECNVIVMVISCLVMCVLELLFANAMDTKLKRYVRFCLDK